MPKEVCWSCKVIKDGVKLCADDRLCPDCDRENERGLAAIRARAQSVTGAVVSASTSSSINRQLPASADDESTKKTDVEVVIANSQGNKNSTDETILPTMQKDLEVDSVLCFLCNKIDNYSKKILESTVLEFFREDEILSAKQSLVHACSKHNKTNTIQQFVKRRIGENKVKSNVDDILNILYTLDENESLDFLPVFCIADTSRIPILADEMTDIGYIRKTVSEMQGHLVTLTSKLQQLLSRRSVTEIATQTDPTDIGAPWSEETLTVNAAAQGVPVDPMIAASVITVNGVSNEASVRSAAVGSVLSVKDGNLVASRARKTAEIPRSLTGYSAALNSLPPAGGSSVSSASSRPSSDVRSTAQRSQPNATRGDDDDGYSLARNKKSRRRKVVIGGQHEAPFRGVEKKVVLCVNRLDPGTNTEDIVAHLESKDVRVFSCFVVKKQHESDSESIPRRFISMRLCVSMSDSDVVMAADSWPRGVTIRHWSFKGKQTANSQPL
jgi:hypothetical protein